jgi:hypothetical protein
MSRAEVTLVIVYNHKFVKNIPLVEKIYSGRFKRIFHLVPFYEGTLPNVIPVYEHSHYFQGYIAQGLKSFFTPESPHYVFLADDLILNPAISEDNYADILELDPDASFIPRLHSMPHAPEFWPHNRSGLLFDPFEAQGIEIRGELPGAAEAAERLGRHGVVNSRFSFDQVYAGPRPPGFTRDNIRYRARQLVRYFSDRFLHGLRLEGTKYPLACSYSDMLVISATSIKRFSHYCGVFAAAELFVELAIPTALALAADKIVTEQDLALKGRPLWSAKDLDELNPYDRHLGRLLRGFPPGYLYLHPIKLSQWSVEDL